MMALINDIAAAGGITREEYRVLLLLLNPFAPHITEELWETLGYGGMVTDQKWPAYDEEKCREDEIEVAVQINGKVRDRITIPAGSEAADAIACAKAAQKIVPLLDGKQIVKEIYVKGKLINIVAK